MRKLLMILCFWVVISAPVISQTVKVVSLPQFVSNSLVVFSKYVNWPLNHKNGDFIITVIGDNEVYKELTGISQGMTVGAQKISVRFYNKVSEVEGFSHIIFLSSNIGGSFRKLTEKISTANTLLVTSSEGLLVSGSGINFIPFDGYMKFELSKNNIQKRNLEIHSWLEKMALKS
jgi:hypothetical protein